MAASIHSATATDARNAWARARAALGGAFRWIVLIGVAIAIVVPIAYAFLGGFRTTGAIRSDPAGLPDPWRLDHYIDALTGATYWQQLVNSTVIATITVIIVVTVSALAAYVFARFQFPGREALFMLFALGLLFPAAVAILPLVHPASDHRSAGQPPRRGPPAGGLRDPAHDHHPATVLPQHPGRAGGRGRHRRLQPLRLLLARAAATFAARARHRRHPRARDRLELLPAAAAHPGRPGPVDAAARRA